MAKCWAACGLRYTLAKQRQAGFQASVHGKTRTRPTTAACAQSRPHPRGVCRWGMKNQEAKKNGGRTRRHGHEISKISPIAQCVREARGAHPGRATAPLSLRLEGTRPRVSSGAVGVDVLRSAPACAAERLKTRPRDVWVCAGEHNRPRQQRAAKDRGGTRTAALHHRPSGACTSGAQLTTSNIFVVKQLNRLTHVAPRSCSSYGMRGSTRTWRRGSGC